DIIFLRNILIYFDADNKKRIIKRLIEKLQPGGHLFIGHSETLSGVTSDLKFIQASVYEKVK
ncbi:MAG: chemotaxis protein methyltransferase CheR, partial [Halothiobacillaceae bacterium]